MKNSIIIKEIEVVSVASEGKAIGYYDGKVVFLRNVVPGDIVDVKIVRKKKNYLEGIVVNFSKHSSNRKKPFCKHHGICGGCSWQILPYEDQLKYKQKQVLDQFERIGKLTVKEVLPIIPSDKTIEYRNKLEYSFTDNRWIFEEEIQKNIEIDRRGAGFHIREHFNRIIDIEKCFLQSEPSNNIRNKVKELGKEFNLSFYNPMTHEGFLRNLIVRNNLKGQFMIILIFGQENLDNIQLILNHIIQNYSEVLSIYYGINTKLNDNISDIELKYYYGEKYLEESLDNITFKIGPKSFFQVNTLQTIKMYQKIKDFLELSGNEIIYDLYCGIGTIGLFLAKFSKKIIGIELLPEAIGDAKLNASINNINNVSFYCGDVKDLINENFINNHGKADYVIVDPPRSGLHPKVLEKISELLPLKIVYVSCNAATQARDIMLLNNFYEVLKIQPLDMFPHTHHVENIALLKRIN